MFTSLAVDDVFLLLWKFDYYSNCNPIGISHPSHAIVFIIIIIIIIIIIRIGLLNENTHDALQLWVSCLRTHQD